MLFVLQNVAVGWCVRGKDTQGPMLDSCLNRPAVQALWVRECRVIFDSGAEAITGPSRALACGVHLLIQVWEQH
jgi:hypothetical protein